MVLLTLIAQTGKMKILRSVLLGFQQPQQQPRPQPRRKPKRQQPRRPQQQQLRQLLHRQPTLQPLPPPPSFQLTKAMLWRKQKQGMTLPSAAAAAATATATAAAAATAAAVEEALISQRRKETTHARQQHPYAARSATAQTQTTRHAARAWTNRSAMVCAVHHTTQTSTSSCMSTR